MSQNVIQFQQDLSWAELIARVCEVFPLLCPMCGGQMRVTTVHHPQRRYPIGDSVKR